MREIRNDKNRKELFDLMESELWIDLLVNVESQILTDVTVKLRYEVSREVSFMSEVEREIILNFLK